VRSNLAIGARMFALGFAVTNRTYACWLAERGCKVMLHVISLKCPGSYVQQAGVTRS
jgi:hypothetical protein